MKLNEACRLLGARVEELTGEAQRVQVGLNILLDGAAARGPAKAVEGSFGEAAVWIGNAMRDMSERLRRLNDVIADLKPAPAATKTRQRAAD